MMETLRELMAHAAWADAELLKAVWAHPAAKADGEMRKVLHHMAAVLYFFSATVLGKEYDVAGHFQAPAEMEAVRAAMMEAHELAAECLRTVKEEELGKPLESGFFKDFQPTWQVALLQAALHSQNHRGQCLMRLRELGAKPPTLDYILWTKDRTSAEWGR